MSHAQALKPTIVNGLIAATITLFTLAMIAWTAPDARATHNRQGSALQRLSFEFAAEQVRPEEIVRRAVGVREAICRLRVRPRQCAFLQFKSN